MQNIPHSLDEAMSLVKLQLGRWNAFEPLIRMGKAQKKNVSFTHTHSQDSKTVLCRRGEKLPENKAAVSVLTAARPPQIRAVTVSVFEQAQREPEQVRGLQAVRASSAEISAHGPRR